MSTQPMTPDEARSVMWLQNNHKPIGELLDTGYLTRKNLEWAAAKAYDKRIRQAAQTLLNWQHQPSSAAAKPTKSDQSPADPSFSSGISLSDARATVWPFGQSKGQAMGALVDNRELSLKDLAYAIENARDKRVRQAAIALTLVRLEQAVTEPEPPAGFLHVIMGGRSFSEYKQIEIAAIWGIILGIWIGLYIGIFVIAFLLSPPPFLVAFLTHQFASLPNFVNFVIVFGLILLIGVGLPFIGLNKLTDILGKRLQNHRKGESGEDRVVTIMSQSLDGNWYLFRNVYLPGRQNADLDGVLVAPSGVWVLETKAYTGEYRNIGDKWEIRAGKGWKRTRKNPSQQANRNALHLKNFLRADSIQQWITPAVIWANPESKVTVENPMVTVWPLDRLPDELGNFQSKVIPEATRQQIIDKLTKLCQRQKEAATQGQLVTETISE